MVAIISKSDSRTITIAKDIKNSVNTIGSSVWRKKDKLDPLFRIAVVSKFFWPDNWFGIDWINGGLSVTVVKSKKKKNKHWYYKYIINNGKYK